MKKNILFLFSIFCISIQGFSQFYYKDIISNNQLVATMQAYKAKKVKTIKINSLESDGSPSTGFFCQKKISRDFRSSDLYTRTEMSGASQLTSSFNADGLLTSTYDSSDLAVAINRFSYDENKRLLKTISFQRSSDDDFNTEVVEEHIYSYNAAGFPEKMYRVKNYKDTSLFLFAADEHNNVSVEKDTRTGSKYYYYYDSRNRLTDIVQASDYTKHLVPDYQFEYNASGNISQMTTTENGGEYYYIWKYSYDDGLRVLEKCFNKERKLLGSMEYVYN